MRNNNTGCLNAVIATFARIMLLGFWFARPVQWNAAMQSPILGCLGFIFLPFTTMMYVWLQTAQAGPLQGLDWVWLGLAVLVDVATVASAGYSNRDRLPTGMSGGNTKV